MIINDKSFCNPRFADGESGQIIVYCTQQGHGVCIDVDHAQYHELKNGLLGEVKHPEVRSIKPYEQLSNQEIRDILFALADHSGLDINADPRFEALNRAVGASVRSGWSGSDG